MGWGFTYFCKGLENLIKPNDMLILCYDLLYKTKQWQWISTSLGTSYSETSTNSYTNKEFQLRGTPYKPKPVQAIQTFAFQTGLVILAIFSHHIRQGGSYNVYDWF